MSETRDLGIRLSLKDGDRTRQGLIAIGDAGQRALERIERSAEPASKSLLALNAASRETRGGMEGLAGRLGPIGSAMGALGTVGLAASAGVAALGLALVAAVQRSRDAAQSFAEIAKEADRVGMGVEAFQEIAYAARNTGVDVEKLGEALKELAGRALDAFQNGGEAAEGFKRIGLEQKDLQSRIGDTDKLFTEVIQRIGSLKTAGERVLTVQQIFGDEGGEPLLALIARGSDEFARLRKEAHAMGVVLDESMIRRGADAARQLDTLSSVIQTNLNAAVVDLAPILVDMARLFADIARAVADVVDGFRDLENRSTRGLRARLVELQADRDLAVKARDATFDGDARAIIKDGGLAGDLSAADTRIAGIDAEIARITGILNERGKALPPTPARPAPAPSPDKPGRSAGSATAEETDRVAEYIGRLRDQNALLGVEESQRQRIKAVMDAQKLAMADGNLLTEQQRNEILGLVDAAEAYEAQARQIADAQAEMGQIGREVAGSIASGFEDAILRGAKLSDVLRGIAQDLARLAIRKAITEPLFNLVGSAIGGIFHTGGIVGQTAAPTRALSPLAWAGAPRYHTGGIAGLAPGEVPAILQSGEGVFTREQMAALGNGGMGGEGNVTINGMTLNVNVEFNGVNPQGSQDEIAQRITREINAQLRGLVNSEMRQQMRPGGMLNNTQWR